MGMSLPLNAGQVPDVSSDVTRRALKTPSSALYRTASTANSITQSDSGLINRAVTARLGSSPTLVVRKKLPWLDGGQPPKADQSSVTLSTTKRLMSRGIISLDEACPTLPTLQTDPDITAQSRRASIASFGLDPSLRAIGSTPSLRRRTKSGKTRRLSLNADSRPGVKPIMSKQHARQVLGGRTAKSEDYTPSEYSTTPTSDRESIQPGLSKRDPASYQRLVQKAVTRKVEAHEPAHIAQRWLQAQVEMSSGDASPASLKQKRRRASSCDSCHLALTEATATLPKAPRLLRQATSFPLAQQQPETVSRRTQLGKPLRPQTLHALPTHLMSPSTSSTDVPSHLVTSTDQSSSSPVSSVRAPPSMTISPRATLRLPAPTVMKVNDPRRDKANLTRAVTGFEHLMDEAIAVANDASHNGRSDDVAHILDSASAALRKASATLPSRRSRLNRPLYLSAHESGASSSSDTDLSDVDGSYAHDRASVETAPTHFTNSPKSSRPVLVDPQAALGRRSTGEISIERFDRRSRSSSHGSIMQTPPRLHQPPSADSVVRDFAYAEARNMRAHTAKSLSLPAGYGAAADFYGDHGESVESQPGTRRSIAPEKILDLARPELPPKAQKPSKESHVWTNRAADSMPASVPRSRRLTKSKLSHLDHQPTKTVPLTRVWHNDRLKDAVSPPPPPPPEPKQRKRDRYQPHVSDFFDNAYYRHPEQDHGNNALRKISTVTDTRSVASNHPPLTEKADSSKHVSGPSQAALLPSRENLSLKHPRRKHISLKEGQGFSLGRYHRRQPIAREWNTVRKRIAAAVACVNTVFIGLIAGIYVGSRAWIGVLGDARSADFYEGRVILGNVLLFVGLGLTTLIFWPLPLLHGRKPYTLMAFSLMLPLQFPQALAVSGYRDPNDPIYRVGLLIPRVLTGLAMGFANINQLPTLFDLFGVSLLSEVPHQEIVVYDDVRRQGGGMGIWLGIWSWCFIGSLSIGFCIGACIIAKLDPAWGFYIVVMLLAFFLLVNVISPETRRAPYRRSIAHFFDDDEKLRRRVARGEVKLHISNDGPKWWFQEVWAGIILTKRMVFQPGYFVLMLYIGWIYAQVTVVILFLGALLSRDYQWRPEYVGLASLAVAIGAALAMPLAKASLFSRARYTPQRTDSMTMRAPRFIWSSHLIRRCVFTLMLPFAALAYTLSATGPPFSWVAPTIFCGLIGFLSNLAIAECVGLIMETFDTCDLQPGVNQKHRLQSMAENVRRRRTNYSSFPRVCAGFFAAQSLGFFLAAAATGVSGHVTRALGAQEATAITAAVLLGVTVLLLLVLWRWKQVQVIPTSVFNSATKKGSIAWGAAAADPDWKPVVIGNPSGKMRRVNLLEMGSLTRWTEIRRLNKLIPK